jgi:hypothetical protein
MQERRPKAGSPRNVFSDFLFEGGKSVRYLLPGTALGVLCTKGAGHSSHPLVYPKGPVMKRSLTLLLVVMFVPFCFENANSDPPPSKQRPPTKLSPLMRMKLENSKEILEGLALEDFDKIGKNARSMKLLSMESGWNVIQTKEYETQSRDFRRTCDLIAEAAAEKDVSRAALGYVAMTVRCVECHAYMRKHKIQLMKLDTH